MSTPVKCRGLLGAIFGHKWTYRLGAWEYNSRHCTRCGHIPGDI